MYLNVNHGRKRKSLGTTSTMVDGSLVYGSDPLGPVSPSPQPFLSNPRRKRRYRDWWQTATNNQGWWMQDAQPMAPEYPGYYAGLSGLGRRRLGLVIAPVRPTAPIAYPVGVGIEPTWGVRPPLVGPVPVVNPMWGFPKLPGAGSGGSSGGPPQAPPWYGSGGSGYGSTQANAQALAVAQALLATNPSLLSPAQYQMLEQAGLISGGVPYSSVSQINPTTSALTTDSSGIDPATGVPYATELAEAQAGGAGAGLSASFYGIPLWGWLIGGGGLFLVLMKRR